MLTPKEEAYLWAVLYLPQPNECNMDMFGKGEVHLDAVIEANEIHIKVSRSFVRPKATSPSLPACLSRVLLESVEHQGDEKRNSTSCI